MWLASIDGPVPVPSALDAEGNPTAWRPEHHLNVPADLYAARPELEPFRVAPSSPQRHYAGECGRAATVFLRFADEAEARDVLGEFWTD